MKLLLSLLVLLGSACGGEDGADSQLATGEDSWLTHPTAAQLASGQAEPGSYIVAFKGIAPSSRYLSLNTHGTRHATMSRLQAFTSKIHRLAASSLLVNLNLSRPGKSFTAPGIRLKPDALNLQFHKPQDDRAAIARVDFESSEAADEALRQWYQDGLVWYAEPNYISKPSGQFEQDIIANFDNSLDYPWLSQINFIEAMRYFDTNPAEGSPVIAVLDSGVDVEHPALVDQVYLNLDGQNQLCTDDLYGCDTTETKKDVLGRGSVYPAGTTGFSQECFGDQSNCAHGSHVTGIVAAQDPDSNYIGICPYCRVLVVKVVGVSVDGDGSESFKIEDSAIIAGLAYVSGFQLNGEPLVRVMNASFGKFEKSRSVGLFVEALTKFGRGILTVAAAGNEDTKNRQYPAALEDVIAVASVDSDAENPSKAPSSNFGMWVDIAAPGSGSCSFQGGILSSIPGGGSACTEGTSMASPVVAGVAGLVLAANPNLDYGQLRDRVLATAVPDNLYRDGTNDAYRPRLGGGSLIPLLGGGVVNAQRAVDPSSIRTSLALTNQRDVVKPGCGSIGQGSGQLSLLGPLLLLPLILLLRRGG